jgi:hypothetical protein
MKKPASPAQSGTVETKRVDLATETYTSEPIQVAKWRAKNNPANTAHLRSLTGILDPAGFLPGWTICHESRHVAAIVSRQAERAIGDIPALNPTLAVNAADPTAPTATKRTTKRMPGTLSIMDPNLKPTVSRHFL